MDDAAATLNLNAMLTAAAAGDAQAWRLLVTSFAPRVYSLLVRQCGDRELAEEITQDTFVKMVTHIGRYQEQGKFEPWLFRIAMNRLRDEMRRRKRHAQSMDMSPSSGRDQQASPWAAAQARLAEQADPAGYDPAEKAARAEQLEQLRSAIAELSAADQEILHLRHTAGLSFPEIAQTLSQPLGTVLARAHRAMNKLKKRLVAAQQQT